MPEFLARAADQVPLIGVDVLIRLVIAMLLGGVVTLVYRFTRPADEIAPSFTVTLVLLSILIAMVTQVIGDNVARAFSLVGALSIVRFRTVVRDTQDTAYVIFAVAVGMSAGAGQPVFAISGIGVVAIAALAMRRGAIAMPERQATFVLKIRIGLGYDASVVLKPVFDEYLGARHLTSIETTKQGVALEQCYTASLRNEDRAEDFVKALNRIEGVQGISLERAGSQKESI